MSVITISRGSFSGGKMLADSVAEKPGYRCLDQDELVEKAALAGVTEHELRVAPMEFRVSMAQQRLGVGRREVIAYIRKVDEERKKWAQYL